MSDTVFVVKQVKKKIPNHCSWKIWDWLLILGIRVKQESYGKMKKKIKMASQDV